MSSGKTLCRCGVTVEVKGKQIGRDKSAKELGVEIIGDPKGTGAGVVRVLGFKREIRLSCRDVQQLGSHRVEEGRLAIVTKDSLQIMLVKGQPAQLGMVVQCLQGKRIGSPPAGAAPAVETPAKRARTAAELATTTPTDRRTAPGVAGAASAPAAPSVAAEAGDAAPLVGMADLPPVIVDDIFAFTATTPAFWSLFSATCRPLAAYVLGKKRPVFRLGATRGAGVPVDRVIEGVARRSLLHTVDLSGYVDLLPSAIPALADALGKLLVGGGEDGLKVLQLRGCKALTDVALRRLLGSTPNLECLDLLEIPKLTDQALRVPLPRLRVLVGGSLGRGQVARLQPKQQPAQTISSLGARISTAPVLPRLPGAAKFTAALLKQLVAPSACAAAAPPGRVAKSSAGFARTASLDPPPLTHVILPNCPDIEAWPMLPETLQHLDLRCASIQVPGAGLTGWKPFARCADLRALCLSGCLGLSGPVLLACLESLPGGASLRLLDLGGARLDAPVLAAIGRSPGMAALTHLRVSGCTAVTNAALTAILRGRQALEVVDVTNCAMLESPIIGLSPDRTVIAPKLRLFGLGMTDFATDLDRTRSALTIIAPAAEVFNGALDFFQGYSKLPPQLL